MLRRCRSNARKRVRGQTRSADGSVATVENRAQASAADAAYSRGENTARRKFRLDFATFGKDGRFATEALRLTGSVCHRLEVHLLEVMHRVFGQFAALGIDDETALVITLRP